LIVGILLIIVVLFIPNGLMSLLPFAKKLRAIPNLHQTERDKVHSGSQS
jgi:hypothetical protein